MDITQNVIKRTKLYLKENRLSIPEMELRAGLREGTLRNLLYGRVKNPTIGTLYKMSRAMDTSIETLISDPEKSLYQKEIDLLIKIAHKVFPPMKTENAEKDDILKMICDIYDYSERTPNKELDDNFFQFSLDRYYREKESPGQPQPKDFK